MASLSPPDLLMIPSSNQQAPSPKSDPSELPRGRKPSKSNKSPPKKNKKRPQRGMGVERLRQLQEKLGGAGSISLPPHPPLTPVAGVYGGSWAGGMSWETSSKELSSIPKLTQSHHHHCDDSCLCSKKKCTEMKDMGLILGIDFRLEVKDFKFKSHETNLPPCQQGHLNLHFICTGYDLQEAGMMGFTGQAASDRTEIEFFPSGKGVKEYEFFPGTTTPGICTSSTNSSAIDLSLKLSL